MEKRKIMVEWEEIRDRMSENYNRRNKEERHI